MRIVFANIGVVSVAVCLMVLGAAVMSLMGTAACIAKPTVAGLFALYLVAAPLLLVAGRSRLSCKQAIGASSLAGCVLFFLGGMLLG